VTFRFEKPIIYLITKGEATRSNFVAARREILDIVRLAVDKNVSLVQLREKRLSARALFELTVATAEITRGSATRLLVNDRADIAVAAGADGVHLTANSLPVEVIRRSFPRDLIVGVWPRF
jgi:thiamine-phosphate pyrophosphorylase